MPQRAALRAALALGPPAAADRFAAYAAALSLIGAVAAESPLLIVVNDAHWLDEPTREALAFCARRIDDEPIAMFGASRDSPLERVEVPGLAELQLEPLAPPADRELLEAATADAHWSRTSRARCSPWPRAARWPSSSCPAP